MVVAAGNDRQFTALCEQVLELDGVADDPRFATNSNRVRNRCEVSGRPRAYYRKLGMSRIALRELGNKGLIPGLVKSSW